MATTDPAGSVVFFTPLLPPCSAIPAPTPTLAVDVVVGNAQLEVIVPLALLLLACAVIVPVSLVERAVLVFIVVDGVALLSVGLVEAPSPLETTDPSKARVTLTRMVVDIPSGKAMAAMTMKLMLACAELDDGDAGGEVLERLDKTGSVSNEMIF